jgi:signal transduction histidine kinase
MTGDAPEENGALRRQAEALLAASAGAAPVPPAPGALSGQERALLHELQVHQVELTLQNAQLRDVRGELEAALVRYRTLYEAAPVGDLLVEADGTIVLGNACAAGLLHLAREALPGHRVAACLEPVDRAAFAAFLRRVLAEDGIHHAEVATMAPEGRPAVLALQGSREPDGRQLRLILVDQTAAREAERLAAHARTLDGERQRLAEALQRAEQEREAQKMQALGVLAGGIAHDFNNHLMAILGYADVARHEPGVPAAVTGWLDGIEHAGRRATDLVRRILAFSRSAPRQLRPVALDRVVHDALRLLELAIPRAIHLDVRVAPGVPDVLGNETELQQGVLNLCTNAWQAVAAVPDRPGTIRITVDVAPSGAPRLEVGDNGVGMDAATQAHVFDAFFTTREAGSGTGLGLAVAHGIVLAHGGTIAVQSEPGEGSTFTVCFPPQDPQVDAAGPAATR